MVVNAWYLWFFFNDTATPEIYTLALHDALPFASAVATHNASGDAHSTLFAGKAEVAKYNATLTTTYAEDSNGYQAQTINISGVLETDEPILNCVTSGTDKDADIAVLQAFSLINRATTGAGTLTVQCFGDAPTVAIPSTLLVVR